MFYLTSLGVIFLSVYKPKQKVCKRVARSVFRKHFTSLDTPITRQAVSI